MRYGSPRADVPHPALAVGAVRHVGDPVALIVAETSQAARDAAEAILVDYDMLPSVTDLGAAMDADQPAVWPDVAHNVCFDWEVGDKARPDALFNGAARPGEDASADYRAQAEAARSARRGLWE